MVLISNVQIPVLICSSQPKSGGFPKVTPLGKKYEDWAEVR